MCYLRRDNQADNIVLGNIVLRDIKLYVNVDI